MAFQACIFDGSLIRPDRGKVPAFKNYKVNKRGVIRGTAVIAERAAECSQETAVPRLPRSLLPSGRRKSESRTVPFIVWGVRGFRGTDSNHCMGGKGVFVVLCLLAPLRVSSFSSSLFLQQRAIPKHLLYSIEAVHSYEEPQA